MVRDLPPLNSLRAFEAAARRLSFTRAAEELGVTQAAISHHVRVLEDRLGFRLFRRLNNGLLLTEKGEAYLPSVRQAFDVLCEATDAVQGHGE
jgi:LysR family glycine cleavage system transcriptional activator